MPALCGSSDRAPPLGAYQNLGTTSRRSRPSQGPGLRTDSALGEDYRVLALGSSESRWAGAAAGRASVQDPLPHIRREVAATGKAIPEVPPHPTRPPTLRANVRNTHAPGRSGRGTPLRLRPATRPGIAYGPARRAQPLSVGSGWPVNEPTRQSSVGARLPGGALRRRTNASPRSGAT